VHVKAVDRSGIHVWYRVASYPNLREPTTRSDAAQGRESIGAVNPTLTIIVCGPAAWCPIAAGFDRRGMRGSQPACPVTL